MPANNPALRHSLYLVILLTGLSTHSLLAQTTEQFSSSLKQLLETNACPGCDLRGANLAHMNLLGANLQSANLSGADLTETNFRGANLSNANLVNTKLIETKLNGANLRNADLSHLDIDEAFEWIEIIGTQLEGARFKNDVTCGPMPKKGGWGCQHL